MEDREELLDDYQNGQHSGTEELPTFLKVLCILTFVGAGLGLLNGLWGLFTMGSLESTFEAASAFGSNPFGAELEEVIRWTKIATYVGLLGNGACLAGALMMWKLKKVGYFIYIAGQLGPIILSFMTVDILTGGGFLGNIGMMAVVIGSLFPIAFIIMYGLNFKHLK